MVLVCFFAVFGAKTAGFGLYNSEAPSANSPVLNELPFEDILRQGPGGGGWLCPRRGVRAKSAMEVAESQWFASLRPGALNGAKGASDEPATAAGEAASKIRSADEAVCIETFCFKRG